MVGSGHEIVIVELNLVDPQQYFLVGFEEEGFYYLLIFQKFL